MNRLRFLLPLLLAVLIFSCQSFDNSPKALVNVLLIDAPAQWDSVIVEIQGVELDFVPDGRDGNIQKIFLAYEPGDKEVDVSQLVGGTSLPVARSEMQMGKITGITLRLGTENALFLDEDRYPLALPGDITDYYQPVEIDLEQGLSYDLILDFDLEKSIQVVQEAPLELDFNPTILAYSGVQRGTISGSVSPTSLRPVIYAFGESDSASTHTDASGNFFFRLQSGIYRLLIDPKNSGYADTLFTVEVEAGDITDLDPVTLAEQ